MKKLILILVVFLAFFGCQEKPQKVEEPQIVEQKKSNNFEISMQLKSDVDDIVQCAFIDVELNERQEALYLISQNITKGEELVNVNFQLFDDYVPSKVQLRFGNKPKTLSIDFIEVKYDTIVTKLNSRQIQQYFSFNKYITQDTLTNTISTKEVNGKHYPYLTLRQRILDDLYDLK